MTVKNELEQAVELYITNVQCVYDHGQEGSNLQIFNNTKLGAGQSCPTSGSQYIEAKNSGSCFFDSSEFTLEVQGIGNITFTDSGNDWTASTTNGAQLKTYVNNSGKQARIDVTIVQI